MHYDLAQMIGAWAGRHKEEEAALTANSVLVKAAHEMFQKAVADGTADEFINLADKSKTTGIQQDAWNMIPRETLRLRLKSVSRRRFATRKSQKIRKDRSPRVDALLTFG
jgi:hypothetical protein